MVLAMILWNIIARCVLLIHERNENQQVPLGSLQEIL